MTIFLGEFTLYGVITKQIFLICPKFEGKVASQSWKHCISDDSMFLHSVDIKSASGLIKII